MSPISKISLLIYFCIAGGSLGAAENSTQTPAGSSEPGLHSPVVIHSSTPQPQTLLLNREGNSFLLKQNFGPALDKYVQALRYDPFQAEVHLNMGLAFEGLQQADKAIQSYKQAAELATNPQIKFMALFNQAQLLGKAKKVDEALPLYKQALDIVPTNKEAKTNIELLTQDPQGGGQGKDDKDKKDDKNKDQGKDQKNKDGKPDPKDDKDKDKDGKEPKDQPKDGKEEKKSYGNSPKYQPRKFDSKELGESDVKKILDELKQQEQKIRAEFNRKDVKEQPRDKDW